MDHLQWAHHVSEIRVIYNTGSSDLDQDLDFDF